MATGTGKTFIAFQLSWKLFQSRWNLSGEPSRRPRILFLADRNILADQAYNAFSAFPEDALVRISPNEIRKKSRVPKNGSIFFTIFQTFMSGTDEVGNPVPNFGDYPKNFFDFIVIDECHRGGANDEGNWRGILEYFSPAVQLGLTATPKRQANVDTYAYFGEPVYIYSLKQGINDGFLTPFKVKQFATTLDDYVYTSDDQLVEGEVEEGRRYKEPEFNRTIEIVEREKYRVKLFMSEIDQREKTLVFCATQGHALLVRDLINQMKISKDPHYCERVTAKDGAIGDQHLREFQDNEKTIPTILTTSQKLSTGVDARNVRNIVLMRPVNSMIEFKQIIGRGTRLFDGKDYFTILDFVKAYEHFNDPEWDGEPLPPPEAKRHAKAGQDDDRAGGEVIPGEDHDDDTAKCLCGHSLRIPQTRWQRLRSICSTVAGHMTSNLRLPLSSFHCTCEVKATAEASLKELADKWANEKPTFDEVLKHELANYGSAATEVLGHALSQAGKAIKSNDPLSILNLRTGLINRFKGLVFLFEKHGVPANSSSVEVLRFLNWPGNECQPIHRVFAYLFAAIAWRISSGQRSEMKASILNDFSAIATYAPYVDAMFIDNQCASLLQQGRLKTELRFRAKIFSLSSRDEFLQYLIDLDTSAPADVRSRSGDMYGLT